MRVPIRKGSKYSELPVDPYITPDKAAEMKRKLSYLKEVARPRESAEVQRLALMGDFSENVGYQVAKGRLRGINQRILDIENHLKIAKIIEPDRSSDAVAIGRKVTVERDGKRKQYLILGSSETDPARGVISYNSPLGGALLGHKAGEEISVTLAGKEAAYRIISLD